MGGLDADLSIVISGDIACGVCCNGFWPDETPDPLLQARRACVFQPRVARSATLGSQRNVFKDSGRTATRFRSGLAEMDGTALRFALERMRWEIWFPGFSEPLGCMTEGRWPSRQRPGSRQWPEGVMRQMKFLLLRASAMVPSIQFWKCHPGISRKHRRKVRSVACGSEPSDG